MKKALPLLIIAGISFGLSILIKVLFFAVFFTTISIMCIVVFLTEIIFLWINKKQYKNSKN
jgi:hypothetical protein